MDIAYVVLVDGVNGLVDAQDVREKVDKALDDTWIDAETWGMDADALDSIPQAARRRDHDGAGQRERDVAT